MIGVAPDTTVLVVRFSVLRVRNYGTPCVARTLSVPVLSPRLRNGWSRPFAPLAPGCIGRRRRRDATRWQRVSMAVDVRPAHVLDPDCEPAQFANYEVDPGNNQNGVGYAKSFEFSAW